MNHTMEDARPASHNLSWGAIFAGVVTFIALLLTLSTIGATLGFGQFDPTQTNPFAGVGIGQIIWTIVEFALAFLGAGFIAGATAQRVGHLHGFLTWATSLIALVVLTTWLAVSALSAAGRAIGGAAQIGGQAIGSVAQSAGEAVSQGVSAVADEISVDEDDIKALNDEVEDVLGDTDVPELQPEYLSDQVDGAQDEIADAAKELLVHPENAEQTIKDLSDKLTARVDDISENVDRQAVANAIEKNSELSQSEAEEATDNIIEGYETAAKETREGIEQASTKLEETKNDLQAQIETLSQEVAEGTNEATNQISAGFIWAFVGLVISAILATCGGTLGVNYATNINSKKS